MGRLFWLKHPSTSILPATLPLRGQDNRLWISRGKRPQGDWLPSEVKAPVPETMDTGALMFSPAVGRPARRVDWSVLPNN